jgi:hypothetical protein
VITTCPLLPFEEPDCYQDELAGCLLVFGHMPIELYHHNPSGEDVNHHILEPSFLIWLHIGLVQNHNKMQVQQHVFCIDIIGAASLSMAYCVQHLYLVILLNNE